MAILKCKMCGGDVELAGDKTCGICEYCGCTMTFPKVDDDQRAAAFNRGNHFRRIGEFDKALAVYERIVQEDNTDAEAHWCCALCRFGIEYVEDPATMEWMPTCHRASFDSFLEDVDYLAAVKYSDGITQRQYQKDAAKIAEVQRGILATSQNAAAYDVFICYKETDAQGNRTKDSLMAQDIYYQLTEQGRKVFFARITLEDVAGAQYEPYIFAALNSAKVMIVVGTSAEHLNAVWVKNEWSRFLSLMKKDHSKLLLPCYRDMDPYDLPEQLSVLQSYDMGKIGFIQDLIRGVAKVLDAEKQTVQPTVVKETIVTGGGGNVAPLLKRAFMFLEDSEWESADEYCEKVLDIDPECAEAYLGKLMSEIQVHKRENLKKQKVPFDKRGNYVKAVRFGDEKLKAELQGYIDYIVNRNFETAYADAMSTMVTAKTEQQYKSAAAKFEEIRNYKDAGERAKECYEKAEETRLSVLYGDAVSAMNSAETEQQYKSAAGKFSAIKTFKDAADKAKLCLEKAEISRKNAIYDSAASSMSKGTIPAYKKAIDAFKTIEEWKDSSTKICDCERSIYEIEQKEKADRIEAARLAKEKRLEEERIAEEKRIADAKAAKKRKALIAIITLLVCACVAFVIVLNTVIIPKGKYEDAVALMNSKKYEDAAVIFEEINTYKDSTEKRKECLYQQAVMYRNDKNWDSANALFEQIKDYKDSYDLLHYHNHSVVDSKDATCTTTGYKTFKCICGDEYTDNISALGHNYSDATCTEAKKCSRCNSTDGSALGHKTGGTKCSRCQTILFETLTYTGRGDKEITGITLPKGKFIIKLVCKNHTETTHLDYAKMTFFSSVDDIDIDMTDYDPSNFEDPTETFSGPVSNGELNVFTFDNISWVITIEAF